MKFKEPGWSIRFGYNYRFPKGRASLILEAGYGMVHIEYFEEREFHIGLLSLLFAWEVLEVKDRFFQLFLGGGLELELMFGRHQDRRLVSGESWLIGIPAMMEGQINVKPNLGIIIGFLPTFCFTGKAPHWALGFILKAGLVWGLKKKNKKAEDEDEDEDE